MKLKSYILLLLLAFFVGSCKESFLDINTNPNALPTASPKFVLTNALNTTAANMRGPNELGSYWSGQWTQSNSYITSTVTFGYSITNGDFNFWDGFYDNLNDYQYVIDNAEANNQKFLLGPAKVMKAYVFHHLVDMYGNIPYIDALQGIKSLAPKFDDQKAVYESLITLLDQAIADCKANAFTSSALGSDIVFKGNTTKWVKFANSLKLRLLIHQARITGRDTYIKTELNKIVTEGSGFITGEDVGSGGAGFYTASTGKLNPIYETWGYSAAGAKQSLSRYPRMTAFLINGLKASNDTFRLRRIAYAIGGEGTTAGVSSKPEILANYVGIPFGVGSGFVADASSSIGPSQIVKGIFDKPIILMTAAEVQFNLAEVKERYGAGISLTGDAKTYFEEGMTQSFRLLGAGVANAAASKFTGIKDYDYTASTNKINTISFQKWLAMCNYSGFEAWTEYRRTNYPITPQSALVPEPNKRPLRLFYPNTELGSNGENVKAQGTIDIFTTKLFWDVD
jgi:hypothetical protein